MSSISPAAIAVMAAAAEDYRLTTPPDQATPAGVAERIAEYLLSSGYAIAPTTEPTTTTTRRTS